MTDEQKEPDYLGHRARLRERFLKGGGKSMADYEIVELLLTYVIPRRDVKPLAKELLRKFESLGGIANASPAKLMELRKMPQSCLNWFTKHRAGFHGKAFLIQMLRLSAIGMP